MVSGMTAIARFVKFTAHPGQGDALAAELLAVAEDAREAKGCQSYLIHRETANPDVVWVSERWASQAASDASLQQARDDAPERIERTKALLAAAPEVIGLDPLGGLGMPSAEPTYTKVNVLEHKDSAPDFGLDAVGEARFVGSTLDAELVGLAHYRMKPGTSHGFGHKHDETEEIYVVLSGSGEVLVEDNTIAVRPLDAVRVSPTAMRMLKSGPDGLEVIAFGTHLPGDGHMEPGWRA